MSSDPRHRTHTVFYTKSFLDIVVSEVLCSGVNGRSIGDRVKGRGNLHTYWKQLVTSWGVVNPHPTFTHVMGHGQGIVNFEILTDDVASLYSTMQNVLDNAKCNEIIDDVIERGRYVFNLLFFELTMNDEQ